VGKNKKTPRPNKVGVKTPLRANARKKKTPPARHSGQKNLY